MCMGSFNRNNLRFPLGFLLTVFIASSQVAYSQNDALRDSAWQAYESKNYKAAASYFERWLQTRKNPHYREYFLLARFNAEAGEREKGIFFLGQAIDQGWDEISSFRSNPKLEVLRTHPRWPELEKKITIEYTHRVSTFYWGVYYGILCLLIAFNTILFVFTREKSYLFYTILVLADLHVEIAFGGGQYTHYFSKVLPWMASGIRPVGAIFGYIMLISYIMFFLSLAQMRKVMPNAYRITIVLLIGVVICFFVEKYSGYPLSLYVGTIVFIFCFVNAIAGLRKGLRHLRLYIFASAMVVLSFAVMMLDEFGLIGMDIMLGPFWPFNIGMILFYFILSFAVGDKMRIMRIEREKAQEKALEVLEQKVQERTAEVVEQKRVIQAKQGEIMDSIHYARRLQEAILPPTDYIDQYIPDNFIYYQPKDVVAGDFYWAENQNGRFYVAAADSTGHGVPGAMVSVVCSTALNRAVKEFGLAETGHILDKTRELVVETFEKSADEVQDGMDISLLCLDSENKTVKWSGANNPLWYVVNGELMELKADKQPVGRTEHSSPFVTHTICLEPDSVFYLFTDGLADQFGGPNGKKFKYKQFQELLLSVCSLPMSEQRIRIREKFDQWKGSFEQVDDVCVIGIAIRN
jgi:serine phosphatase RsbU (regulator of sigma subunit)